MSRSYRFLQVRKCTMTMTTSATYYPAGFTNNAIASVSRYNAPAAGVRVVTWAEGDAVFKGGNLSGPFTNAILIGTDNKVQNTSSNKLTLTLNRTNGVFKGSVTPPGALRSIPVQGVFLQKLDVGYWYALGTNQSSSVVVESR
jgi:hypothetical protein